MVKVKIEKMDFEGRGIGYIKNKIIFIPQVLPEEIVEAEIVKEKKTFQIGRAQKLLTCNEKRIIPKCPYYGECGGCNYQHVSYEESVLFKSKGLTELFSRSGLWNKEVEVKRSKSPFSYRNKLSLKVENGQMGFYSLETHNFVKIEHCNIAKEKINAVIKDFSLFSFYQGEIILRCNENDEILMHLITQEEIVIDPSFYTRHKIVGLLHNHRVIYGNSFFFERINGVLYQVSMDSFFQIHHDMSKELFLYVQEACNGTQNLFDLYCGVGTLGLQVHQKGIKITGIEIVSSAIFNAVKNAKLNQRTDCFYHLGKVEDLISKIPMNFDTVLVDPPRSGLDEKTRKTILQIKPEKIVYVSCNPSTLLRDLKELSLDYHLVSVQGFDMFPYTKHVECVCVLNRR